MSHIDIHTHTFQPAAPSGAVCECHTLFHVSHPQLTFAEQLDALLEALTSFLAAHPAQQPVFRRFFLSDAANQQACLEERLGEVPFCATSIVQQPPLDGTKIALWLYTASLPEAECGVFSHNGYTYYWMGGVIPYSRAGLSSLAGTSRKGLSPAGSGTGGPLSLLLRRGQGEGESDSEHQTKDLFDSLFAELRPLEMTIEEHCVRTWLFVHDVDVNYGGVVTGRKMYFNRIGLTPKTHFIASTGIEGRHANPEVLVQMDACNVKGLQPGQLTYLYAKDHLNPTYEYGVTFERGTAVTYGDRRHIFISGTASIDNKGEVLFVGDIERQTLRMLENIGALLSEGGMTMRDIAVAIVYLRDTADAPRVREILSRELPTLGYELVLAPVCRPTWLIEMECIALQPVSGNNYLPF